MAENPTQATDNKRTFLGFNLHFWILVIGTLINATGSALVFPFISLYIGRTFNANEVEIGLVFSLYAAVSLFSGAAGGVLTDRFGRKGVMIVGLVAAIVFALIMAFAQTLAVVLMAIVVNGLLAPIFGPAVNAMIADMLPEERRPRGYGLIRVAANLGVVVGPLLGGLLADREGGFLLLFIGDALTSGIFALVILFLIPETRPKSKRDDADAPQEAKSTSAWRDSLKLFEGYGQVIRDTPFLMFSLVFLAGTIVYSQMNTNLVLYLDKEFSITAEQYSMLIALNAAMVVLFQFSITTRIEHRNRMMIMAFGTLCYGIGFGMFGYSGDMWWLALGMAVLTIGEMVIVPVAQAVAADMAPEDMRGRYMGFYGLTWSLSFGIGPFLGGVILSSGGGDYRRYLWYFSLVIGVSGAAAFLALGRYFRKRAARIRWAEVRERYQPGREEAKQATQELAAIAGSPVIPGARSGGG